MSETTALFLSSGDLLADRRYDRARGLEADGDVAAAADLLVQALERAPDFAAAWFALGEIRARGGDNAGAVAAFRRALAADPADRHGAALRLVRLGAGDPADAMSRAYVRTLFDQYASGFEAALLNGLDYCGPAQLRAAVEQVVAGRGGPMRFVRALDLGCGTGLAAAAFRDICGPMIGVDLSPAMAEIARRKNLYAEIAVDDMTAFIEQQANGSFDLVIAADALVYIADLAPVCRALARVLAPGGLFAFTVETHSAAGVALGEKLRFAHGADHVRSAVEAAALVPIICKAVSTRTESGVPVPGLMAVAGRV